MPHLLPNRRMWRQREICQRILEMDQVAGISPLFFLTENPNWIHSFFLPKPILPSTSKKGRNNNKNKFLINKTPDGRLSPSKSMPCHVFPHSRNHEQVFKRIQKTKRGLIWHFVAFCETFLLIFEIVEVSRFFSESKKMLFQFFWNQSKP